MPEFEVAKPQIAKEEEFVPSRQNSVTTKTPNPTRQESPDALVDDAKEEMMHHAPLKRGRLPRTRRGADDGAAEAMGETNEHNSVFNDALSQKLSSQPSAKHDKRSQEHASSLRKTTRILDENRQEIVESSSPSSESDSRGHATRPRGGSRSTTPSQRSDRKEPSPFKKNERHDKASYDQCDVPEDSHKNCRRDKKRTIWSKLWHMLTGCFTDASCGCCDKQSAPKGTLKNVPEPCSIRGGRNKRETERRNGDLSQKKRNTRKNFK
ncbi:MAG: hypothetical protein LBG98_02705 [Puniceicoccales bacterium]|jgi:hypothetical protein|nr:hypothetical protein [Puniceicoccales bacterium]